jgi:hypothetical protein
MGFVFPRINIMYRFNLFDFIIKLLLIPVLIIIGIYKLFMWFVRAVITETGNGLVKVTARLMVAAVVLVAIGATFS